MSDGSHIEWTDASWTPIRARSIAAPRAVGWHCEHVSEGCRNCYAETMNHRLGTGLPYTKPARHQVQVELDEKTLLAPLRWRKPRKVFVCSMTDLFGDWVTDEMLDRVFAVMALCPQHVFQILTKRPERMRAYLATVEVWARVEVQARKLHHGDCKACRKADWEYRRRPHLNGKVLIGPLPNVWLGTSVEDQAAADARIPELLATPAAVRFLSCEPLLGNIDLRRWLGANSEQGERDLPSDRGRGANDRFRGPGMALGIAPGGPVDGNSALSPLRGTQGREPDRRSGIPSGAGDVRWAEDSRAGASSGVSPLLRADPERHGDQPQERGQAGQPSLEPRGGDLFGEHGALTEGARARTHRSERDSQRDGEGYAGACGSDPRTESDWGEAGVARGGVRHHISGGVEDSAQGPLGGISWLICGGESGPGAQPCDLAWIRSLVTQCREAGVPVFVKQLGSKPYTALSDMGFGPEVRGTHPDVQMSWVPNYGENWGPKLRDRKGGDPEEWPEDLRIREWPEVGR